MISSRLKISDSDQEARIANNYFEDFAQLLNYSRREMLHLRLLTEETVGMLNAILENYEGEVWLEGEKDWFKIHFSIHASVNADMRDTLLEVSTTGKNAAARGIMGKIGTAIANGLSDYANAVDMSKDYKLSAGSMWRMGVDSQVDSMDMAAYSWSLERYKSAVYEEMHSSGSGEEEWDELEKSIVAKLADEVTVGVRGGDVNITLLRTVQPA